MDNNLTERQKRITKKQNKTRKLYYVILFICIAVIIILLDVIFLTSPDRKLSETENRNLQQAPELTFSSAANGRFETAFENYVASADAQDWADSWYASHPANYDDPAQILALMDERFSDPDLKYWKTADSTDAQPRYVIKSGEETLATLTLSGSGLDWRVTDVQVELEGG